MLDNNQIYQVCQDISSLLNIPYDSSKVSSIAQYAIDLGLNVMGKQGSSANPITCVYNLQELTANNILVVLSGTINDVAIAGIVGYIDKNEVNLHSYTETFNVADIKELHLLFIYDNDTDINQFVKYK
jgi:hypothetical protein